ncbi:hypothetical protein NDU88_003867 [Pleurodeles waltl]|uniref:Uncharacterized protein n=1 Tax=Pleurodeles waltl TaxID=8319 RepID=A0AAV7LMS9_PLEWA|nr:hypothetical protein NDU88_003867 [Pleurodeles waltl]
MTKWPQTGEGSCSKWRPRHVRSRGSVVYAVLITASGEHGGSQNAGDLSGRSPLGIQLGPACLGRARSGMGGAATGKSRPVPLLHGELSRVSACLPHPWRSQIISRTSRRSRADPSASLRPRGTRRGAHRTRRL